MTPASEGTAVTFSDLGLPAPVLAALIELGFEAPTDIQQVTIGPLIEGRDVLARARTGSGKTAAFGLPMLTRLAEGGKQVRGLVLTPTRELALQVAEAMRSYATKLPLEIATVYGGAAYAPQLNALRRGATIVVGTPGRVIDMLDRGALNLDAVEFLVLDEADEMLKMGFAEDVDRITGATPASRQVALFSATVPDGILKIARRHLKNPQEIAVESRAMNTDHVLQQVMVAPRPRKLEALGRWLASHERDATLIFARTRAGCAEVAQALMDRGFSADALHGDLSQNLREQVLNRLRNRQLEILVATDVAARGLDIDHISHVVNLDLPDDAEVYVHRIGRTARAGRSGTALTLVAPNERERMRRIARTLKLNLNEIQVPTDVEIAAFRQVGLRVALDEVPDHAIADAAALIERWGDSEKDLALAALALLCRDRRVPLSFAREQRPVNAGPSLPEVQLFVAAGKRHGVRPQDLVFALAETRDVPSSQIGKIRIEERKSFVGLPGDVAQRLVKEAPELDVCNVNAKIALAHPGA